MTEGRVCSCFSHVARILNSKNEIITVPIPGIRRRCVDDAWAYRRRVERAWYLESMYDWPRSIFFMLQAHMKFPPDYPYSPPSIRFMTKVWHPNVYEVSEYIRELSIPRMPLFPPSPFRPFPRRGVYVRVLPVSLASLFRSSRLSPRLSPHRITAVSRSVCVRLSLSFTLRRHSFYNHQLLHRHFQRLWNHPGRPNPLRPIASHRNATASRRAGGEAGA